MKKFLLVVWMPACLASMGTLGCGEKLKGIPDTQIGLSRSSVFDAPAPDTTRTNRSDPGDRPVMPSAFPGQPPVIPHGMDEFLPITLVDNQCIDCHGVEEKAPGESTPIPRSHYVDLRGAPGVDGDVVVGARYNCVSCHVSPGDNEPIVENVFGN
jgi:cytochrome c-type protein NapB